jgi:hypothetical protein
MPPSPPSGFELTAWRSAWKLQAELANKKTMATLRKIRDVEIKVMISFDVLVGAP